ncbi:RNA-binding protein Musashi 2 [Tetrabaena socialis]|uniref:RNA-binding protein Musashi 2 n=1 Tax=Tetrabaena socialis TaxID=47790 RepID=A0A2J8AK39_9CHLO|nr:RNA-binding protein Musashi 2 [Tetrabaena socialis]|eukprot:PNH12873.1 RNA-binding protein Musashi 2 [Tetrabaena socialis]
MAAQEDELAAPSGGAPGAKLFLGGLSWDTTEEKLKEYFSKYGEVQDVVVMKDRLTRRPRGFGFITFADPAAAQAACAEQHNIDGRQIDAKPSVPHGEGGQQPRSKKIFVGGLAPETDDAQLKEYFDQFGPVSEALVMVDHNSGRSRGFGFVTFGDEAAVEKVFTAGQMHELGGKQVEVKSATPKGSGPQSGRGGGRGGAVSAGGFVAGGRGYAGGRGGGGGYYQAGGYGGYGAGEVEGYNNGGYPGQFPGYGAGYGGYGAGYGQFGMMGYGAGYGGMMGYGYGGYGAYGGYGQQQGAERYHPYGGQQQG